MPLSTEQLRILEESRSNFGCGSDTCKRCYPVQYRCDYCNEDFAQPIANGEHYECEECGYDNKDKY